MATNQALLTPPELEARIDEFYDAVEQYNDGMWFESHETLEDLWMVTPLSDRDFFQGVIQLAAAFVHFARGEYPGIFKLLDASEEKLRRFAPSHRGVDAGALVEGIARARTELRALGEERFLEWDARKVPQIQFDRPA